MNRTMKCASFELRHNFRSVVIFLGIYLFFFLLNLTLGVAGGRGQNGNFGMALAFPFLIFLFVYATASFANHYNFLMMLGNTRDAVLRAMIVSIASVSVAAALLTALFDFICPLLLSPFGIHYFNVLSLIYPNCGALRQLLWYLSSYLLVSFLSLLIGTFQYRFGRPFIFGFWIAFGFLWMILPTVLLEFKAAGQAVLQAGKWFIGYGSAGGALAASLHSIVLAAVFLLAAWLFGRRLELSIPRVRRG